MLRSRRQGIYESVVNELETSNVNRVALRLREFGFLVHSYPKFNFADADPPLTPDLLIVDKKTGLVAVGDYKHAVPPRSPAEVANKLKERKVWNTQLQRYLEYAQQHLMHIQKHFGENTMVTGLCGFVLHRWPLPIPSNQEKHIAYIDAVTLDKVLRGSPNVTLDAILGFFFNEQHISEKPRLTHKIEHLQTVVGEWSYFRPVIIGRQLAELKTESQHD
jgi:hypothetical protein